MYIFGYCDFCRRESQLVNIQFSLAVIDRDPLYSFYVCNGGCDK
jgi:hypothetical protein